MNKLNWILTGMIIGCLVILGILIKENKDLIKKNEELKSQVKYYKWQLEEVPTIIESNKEEICK